MVTAVTRIQSVDSPDGGSAPRDDLYSSEWDLDSPRDRSPVKTSSPIDGHRDKTTGTIWLLCTIWLCCSMEQPAGSSGRRGTAPPTEPGFSQGFFSVLSPMEFWFLAAVASGLLSWGHLISSDIVDLIAQILFKLNWAGHWHHWIQWWTTCMNLYNCIMVHPSFTFGLQS